MEKDSFDRSDIPEEKEPQGDPVADFIYVLRGLVPRSVVDGALYLINEWWDYSQSEQYRNRAAARCKMMDRVVEQAFKNLQPAEASQVVCSLVPDQFQHFPIWRQKTLRIAGRDVTASELFEDPLTCVLAWFGIVGIYEGKLVPGYSFAPDGEYLNETMRGAASNLGHFFSNPDWRKLVLAEVAKQYDLDNIKMERAVDEILPAQESLDEGVYVLKKLMAWMRDEFMEPYVKLHKANQFYMHCQNQYSPDLFVMHVKARTAGALIPSEHRGDKGPEKNPARRDYFDKGVLGPGAEEVLIYYQWDSKDTALKLAEEQRAAEKVGQGEQHKKETIANLSRYLARPNIELSEASFSGMWSWKSSYTLTSDRSVVFSERRPNLRKIMRGLQLEEETRDFLAARGCDYLQGWLYGRAEPLDALLPVLVSGQPLPAITP